ncbi:glycosyltransferase, partial [gut metagenome]
RVGTVTHFPLSRPDQILMHSFSIAIAYSLLTTVLILIAKEAIHPVLAVAEYYIAVLFFILLNRLVWRKGLQSWRRRSNVVQRVVYVGNLGIARELFMKMNQDRSTGYQIVGYFADQPDVDLAVDVPYLGTPNEVTRWLKNHPMQINQLYSTLHSNHKQSAAILQACENTMVHFFVIPSYRTYIHHSMHFELMYGVPVLSLRREPL